jgi:NADH:ubiquinone oxidoreductase subunit 4 (subunit M)
MVLAAMYMLRAVSAVLHQDVGAAVSDAALDLRSGEVAIVGPLVGLLLFLSAWPAAISGHAFGGDRAEAQVTVQLRFAAARDRRVTPARTTSVPATRLTTVAARVKK